MTVSSSNTMLSFMPDTSNIEFWRTDSDDLEYLDVYIGRGVKMETPEETLMIIASKIKDGCTEGQEVYEDITTYWKITLSSF